MSKNRDDLVVNVMNKVNSVIPLDAEAIQRSAAYVEKMADVDKTIHLGSAMYLADNLPLILYGLVTNAGKFRQYFFVSYSKYAIIESNIVKQQMLNNQFSAAEIKRLNDLKGSHKLQYGDAPSEELAVFGKKEYAPEVYDNLSMMVDDAWSHFDMAHLKDLVDNVVDPGVVRFLTDILSNYKWLIYMAAYDGILINLLDKIDWRESANIS